MFVESPPPGYLSEDGDSQAMGEFIFMLYGELS